MANHCLFVGRIISVDALIFGVYFTCAVVILMFCLHYQQTGQLSFYRPACVVTETSEKKALKMWLSEEVGRQIEQLLDSLNFGRNFASAAAGAVVFDSSSSWKDGYVSEPNPLTALKPTMDVGDCWPMKGQSGHLLVRLAVAAVVETFTIQHIPSSHHLCCFPEEAPKGFSVFGIERLDQRDSPHFFGAYSYDPNGPPYQLFYVTNMSDKPFSFVDLVISSNHGHPQQTCIYRFMVHGHMQRDLCLI